MPRSAAGRGRIRAPREKGRGRWRGPFLPEEGRRGAEATAGYPPPRAPQSTAPVITGGGGPWGIISAADLRIDPRCIRVSIKKGAARTGGGTAPSSKAAARRSAESPRALPHNAGHAGPKNALDERDGLSPI